MRQGKNHSLDLINYLLAIIYIYIYKIDSKFTLFIFIYIII
jgi:hypothetical protein